MDLTQTAAYLTCVTEADPRGDRAHARCVGRYGAVHRHRYSAVYSIHKHSTVFSSNHLKNKFRFEEI